jgi:hypothetical protein
MGFAKPEVLLSNYSVYTHLSISRSVKNGKSSTSFLFRFVSIMIQGSAKLLPTEGAAFEKGQQ